VTELAASEKSAGKTYEESVKGRWKIESESLKMLGKIEDKKFINAESKQVLSATGRKQKIGILKQ